MVGNPTEWEFVGMVCEKLITNCPVTVHNVDNANQIFGPDLANLRGKMTRMKLDHIGVNFIEIPWDFVKYIRM